MGAQQTTEARASQALQTGATAGDENQKADEYVALKWRRKRMSRRTKTRKLKGKRKDSKWQQNPNKRQGTGRFGSHRKKK